MRVALATLSKRAHPVSAYLFGSRAEGRADPWSDYDLAVFIEGAEKWDLQKRARFSADIQKEAGDDIELHIFSAIQATGPDPVGRDVPTEDRGNERNKPSSPRRQRFFSVG